MKLSNKLILSFALLSSTVMAADFQLQNIRVGGVGCPSETTQIVLAPDSSAASIIFQQFESRVPNLDAGPKVQRNISTLNCNIFLDVRIPSGVRLESLEVATDLRGFATFDRGVQGLFRSILVSKAGLGTEQGSRDPEILAEKAWMNSSVSQQEDFTVNTNKVISIPSQCSRGNDVVSIRLQNTLSSQILQGMNSQAQGSITMDTSDIRGGLRIRANTGSCYESSTNTRAPGRNCRIVRVNGRSQQVCL